MIIHARRHRNLTFANLKKIGVVLKRAQYFITCKELGMPTIHELKPEGVKQIIMKNDLLPKRKKQEGPKQLSLFP